ncbi:terminase small subunit [Neorhodopirellula lusitana]|uniref:terminase small subunit n=1 Tax=Neorhodopirellula lusitana TaxID=445327 RepID=UPI00384D2706
MSAGNLIEVQRGPHVRKLEGLNVRQLRFINELLANPRCDLTQAAKAAGYKHPSVAGSRLMRQPTVQRAVSRAIVERLERTKEQSDETLLFLYDALMVDVSEFYERDDSGVLWPKSFEDIDPANRRFINGIEKNADGELIGYVLMDKTQLLFTLCLHTGLIPPGTPMERKKPSKSRLRSKSRITQAARRRRNARR